MRSDHCFDKLVHPKVFGPPGLRSNGIHWFCRHCPIFHPLLWTRARRLAWQWRLQWIYQQISTVAYSQGSSKLWFTFSNRQRRVAARDSSPGLKSCACLLHSSSLVLIVCRRRGTRIRTARERTNNGRTETTTKNISSYNSSWSTQVVLVSRDFFL